MNHVGCTQGYATDQLFMNGKSKDLIKCNVHLATYWTVISFAIIVRVLVSIIGVKVSYQLYNLRKNMKGSTRSNRFPVTTFIETIQTIYVSILMIFSGYGYGTEVDGLTMMLYSIGICLFMFVFIMSCLKMVHLGEKILPKHIRKEFYDIDKMNEKDLQRLKGLSSINDDWMLRILFYLMVLLTYGPFLIVLFPGYIFYNTSKVVGDEDFYSRLFLLIQVFPNTFGLLIFWRQTTRVTTYLKICMQEYNPNSKVNSLEGTISKMQKRVLVHFFAISPCIFLLLVVGVGYPLRWWIAPLLFGLAAVSSLGAILAFAPSGNKSSSASKPAVQDADHHENKNNQRVVNVNPVNDNNISSLTSSNRKVETSSPLS